MMSSEGIFEVFPMVAEEAVKYNIPSLQRSIYNKKQINRSTHEAAFTKASKYQIPEERALVT